MFLDHDGTVVLQSSIVKTPGLEDLGTAAEHGYFIKWNQNFNRESSPLLMDFDWKRIADSVMQLYTEAIDGSYIETKENALIWHYQDADIDFRSCQVTKLLNLVDWG